MIDTSNWKEFILGDLFALVNSKAYHTKDITETSSEDGLLYVTRSKFNNGIKCRVESKTEYIVNPSGTISFGAENADFFYQTEKYITGNKMYYIDTRNISEKAALFFKGVLEATFTKNFSFSDGMVPDRIRGEIVKLPVTPTGEPDWEYMESYMKNIMEESGGSIENLRKTDDHKHLIDVSGWGEFTLTDGDIFHISRGQRLKGEDRKPGNVRYFSASNENNGLTDEISNPLFIERDAIIFSTFGDAYYVKGEFTASDEISIFKNNKMNEYSALFICGALKALKSQFQFNEKAFYNNYKDKKIKLPVTAEGEPDWGYMESYMKNIEKDVEEKVNMLAI